MPPRAPQVQAHRVIVIPVRIAADEVEKGKDVPFLDPKSAVHIGLAQFERGIEGGAARRCPVSETNAYTRSIHAVCAIAMAFAGGIHHFKDALADQVARKPVE